MAHSTAFILRRLRRAAILWLVLGLIPCVLYVAGTGYTFEADHAPGGPRVTHNHRNDRGELRYVDVTTGGPPLRHGEVFIPLDPFILGLGFGHIPHSAYHFEMRYFTVSDWVLGVPFLVLAFRRFRAAVVFRERVEAGKVCSACGYDLRAHARDGRCPECGTVREGFTNVTVAERLAALRKWAVAFTVAGAVCMIAWLAGAGCTIIRGSGPPGTVDTSVEANGMGYVALVIANCPAPEARGLAIASGFGVGWGKALGAPQGVRANYFLVSDWIFAFLFWLPAYAITGRYRNLRAAHREPGSAVAQKA